MSAAILSALLRANLAGSVAILLILALRQAAMGVEGWTMQM